MTSRHLASIRLSPLFAAALALGVACAPADPPSDAGTDAGPGEEEETGPVCTELADVPCEDQQFLELALQDDVSPREILSNTPLAGGGFDTHVDATAGGFNAPPESFVYGRFTEDGLEKVEISDEEAFVSMDWDIAVRRYVVRLNSGISGGSCVTGGRVGGGVTFEGLTEVPDNVTLYEEQYFESESCEFIADGSGLTSSPASVLASFYTYTGCLQMNGNVYLVQLADGRHVKLQMRTFYDEDVQEFCDETGTLPNTPSGSGNVRFKWAFVD